MKETQKSNPEGYTVRLIMQKNREPIRHENSFNWLRIDRNTPVRILQCPVCEAGIPQVVYRQYINSLSPKSPQDLDLKFE